VAGVVALDLPAGAPFVAALRRVWDRGDAALPIDQRLPGPARGALLAALQPTSIIDPEGEIDLTGQPTDDGDALVIATSGTTGTPKGAVLTHDAVRASAVATSERLGVGADDHWLACLPLSHIGGLSVVTRALVTGTLLTVLPAFDAAAVHKAAAHGATLVSLVATALRRIDPSLFRWIVLGGSRPPDSRPANTVATYGMTETGSGVVYDGVPLAGVEVRIADDGEVLVRCAMLLRSYRDGSSPIDADGWLHTDDIGQWLPDGRLQVQGRRGDVIVTGGENVWPDAVEAILATHPAVGEVAVAGVADHEWGARVVAWVVPARGSTPPSLDALRDHVRRELPAFMAPHELHLVESLPRSGLGKVIRSSLGQSDTRAAHPY
jgi:O-succinylbenzoic acid--CoA ligase